jgi:hypothetical protein
VAGHCRHRIDAQKGWGFEEFVGSAVQLPHRENRGLAKSGDIRVHRLSMTARCDENALTRAVRRVSGQQATDRQR